MALLEFMFTYLTEGEYSGSVYRSVEGIELLIAFVGQLEIEEYFSIAVLQQLINGTMGTLSKYRDA